MRHRQPVGVAGAVDPVEVQFAPVLARVEPRSPARPPGRPASPRSVRPAARRRCPSSPAARRKSSSGPNAMRLDLGARGAQLLRDLGFQLPHGLRIEAQHDALAALDLQRRDDPARHVGPGKACLRR